MKITRKILFVLIVALFLFISLTSAFAFELVLQPDGDNGKDAFIHTVHPDMNFGDLVWLTINNAGTDHGLIEFDVSTVPSNATINSATLELLEDGNCSFNTNSIEVHTNEGPWSESSVTWNSAPTYGPLLVTNTGEGAGSVCEWLVFDVTAIVQDWVDGTGTNYGFRITGPSNGDVVKNILSSDYGIAAERPILRVDYTLEAGCNWLGDINCDEEIDISDVILVLRMALGLDPWKQCTCLPCE